jgi:hypothetical protein
MEHLKEWNKKALGKCISMLILINELLAEFKIKFQNEKDELSAQNISKLIKQLSSALVAIMDKAVKVESMRRA